MIHRPRSDAAVYGEPVPRPPDEPTEKGLRDRLPIRGRNVRIHLATSVVASRCAVQAGTGPFPFPLCGLLRLSVRTAPPRSSDRGGGSSPTGRHHPTRRGERPHHRRGSPCRWRLAVAACPGPRCRRARADGRPTGAQQSRPPQSVDPKSILLRARPTGLLRLHVAGIAAVKRALHGLNVARRSSRAVEPA